MRDTERGRDTGRGRSRLHVESLMWDSIQGLQITPGASGGAKPLRHRGCPDLIFFLLDSILFDSLRFDYIRFSLIRFDLIFLIHFLFFYS